MLKLETTVMFIALGITGAIAIYAIWKFSTVHAKAPTTILQPIQLESENTKLLKSINEHIANQIPEGRTENRTVTVTGTTVSVVTDDTYDGLNWIACDITNQGPGVLYYDVNEWRNPAQPLQVGGSIRVDLKVKGAIKKLFFASNIGGTATASIDGLK